MSPLVRRCSEPRLAALGAQAESLRYTGLAMVIACLLLAGRTEAGVSEGDPHWAFRPIGKADPPAITDEDHPGWPRNQIDHFILARLKGAGITPAPEADPRTLIRRLTFNLTGLPPTAAEVEEFTKDPSPDAWEQLIDRLLASPRYGERQARAWLDLVRYSDSDGYKADVYRPHAWRYRDYVIRSFNADKPYSRFVEEQLAGDELYPDDPEALIATGYLRLWPYEDNQIDVQRQWRAILHDITQNAGEVFMGMGVRCAQCHDHKYDPIPQSDYYRLQSFFAGIMPQTSDRFHPPETLAAGRTAREEWSRQTAPLRDQIELIKSKALKSRERNVYKKFPDYLKVIWDKEPSLRTPFENQLIHLADLQVFNKGGALKHKDGTRKALNVLTETLKQFDHLKPEGLPVIMGVRDVGREAPPTFIEGAAEKTAVAPGFLSVLSPGTAAVEPCAGSSGRRTALARWLTRPEHPLTSRTIVNRIWQQHFGTGIVGTPNDLGRQGDRPTHPALLDWLAGRFIADGGSLKKLHRLIATSATFRQSSNSPPSSAAASSDPDNRLLWKMRMRRLEGEELRDAMLAVSGELDLRAFGKGVKGDKPRRSIYLNNIRNRQEEMLKAFDAADMFNSCARRISTTTPLQSLLMINGDWSTHRARSTVESILKHDPQADTAAIINRAYRRVLSRDADAGELSEGVQYLDAAGGETLETAAGFCHVLLNANEFLFLD